MLAMLLPLVAYAHEENVAGGFAAFFGICCWGSMCLLGPLMLAFWIWMLVEVATKEPGTGNDRLIWLLVVILAGFIGALIYFFVRRPQRKRLYGQ